MKKIIWILLFIPFHLFAQINESDTLRLQTRVNIGGNWQEGNFEIFTLRAKADLSTMLGNGTWVFKTQNNYLYQEVFKTRVDEDIFSRNFLYFKPQSRIYGFAIGFISTNFRRKIDIRYFGGGGATWQIIRTDKNILKIAAGILYEETKFKIDNFNIDFYDGSRFINVLRSSHWLIGKHEMFGGKVILDYYCFIQPSLQRADNYRWQVEASLDFPLSKALKVGVSYIYTYENVIADRLRNFDQFFTYGFTYQFKK
jgi:hypothetical protein